MNPSAAGWINKFGQLVSKNPDNYSNFQDLYNGLKKTGFVYGINTQVPRFIEAEHTLSEDEKAKLNLLIGLYFVYTLEEQSTNFELFVSTIFNFYQDLGVHQISFLNKILTAKKHRVNLKN